ncbi:Mur ligase middle domain protein [Mesorhizobium sp. ORS 3324]|nr:Mur ligase middle domain protein [Mesorhizobium sp. ORS 3324]
MGAWRRKISEDIGWRLRCYLARRARARSAATFIGVTGSSGKSTTTSLLGSILASHGSVHVQALFNTIKALVRTLYKRMKRAGKVDYVVFEAGAYGVDSIRPMAEMLKPDVAIVTMVRLEHFASFRTLEAVAQEKRALVDALQPGGFAVLNADDLHVLGMAYGLSSRVVTFGQLQQADYRASDIRATWPEGLTFLIHWRGGTLELKTRLPGEHFWLPVTAAVATALELGVAAHKVTDCVAAFEPLVNRCEVVTIENGPQFIVDSAKAPWHSIDLAIDMVAKAKAGRKRVILGQISDYAGSTRKYAQAYASAREVADEVIYTGDNAHRSRATQEDRDSGRFREIRMLKDVSDHIRKTAVAGELILLKSAPNLHLERVALAWKHDVKCWVHACGKKESCQLCGLYEVPFEEHRDFLAKRKLARRRHRLGRLLSG